MRIDTTAALFLALGQTADRTVETLKDIVPKDALLLSASYDLAEIVPDSVKSATRASEAYRLFFVFEQYMRELIVDNYLVGSRPSRCKGRGLSTRADRGSEELDGLGLTRQVGSHDAAADA